MRRGFLIAAMFLVSALALFAAGGAEAATPAPWWHISSHLEPSTLAPGAEGTLVVQAVDVGSGPTTGPIRFSDQLPPGLELKGVSFFSSSYDEGQEDLGPEGGSGFYELCETTTNSVSCSTLSPPFGFEPVGPLVSFGFLEFRIRVAASTEAADGETNSVALSGGGAPSRTAVRPVSIGAGPIGFGAEAFELLPEAEGGGVVTQAGAHPYQLTTTFNLNQVGGGRAPALPRDLHFRLPPGLVGNAKSLPQCSDQDFAHLHQGGFVDFCAGDTAIGVANVTVSQSATFKPTYSIPIFNLAPAFGEPARFGFAILGSPVILDTAVRSGAGEDYGITVSTDETTQAVGLISSTVTFWGAPGDISHNEARGWGCLEGGRYGGVAEQACIPSTEAHPPAFLTMPTDCSAAFDPLVEGISWPLASAPGGLTLPRREAPLQGSAGQPLSLTGCNQLSFAPAIESKPTALAPESPSGLNFDLDFRNEGLESAEGLAESEVKETVVTLPKGVTTNPAVAANLIGCSGAQYEAESLEGTGGCPEASKVGEVEIESPLVRPTIDGSIYVARQGQNPNHNLLTIYMVAKNPELGILVRSAGAVSPDPQTGQLTTTFGRPGEPLPQLPFSHFHLHFIEGPRAPLITPRTCGTYSTQALLYPWSSPQVATERGGTFTIGQPCAASESALPNRPSFEAGTVSPLAGTYSPFVLKLSREDGSQQFSTIQTTLPAGLLGRLAGVPYCPQAGIAQAEGRSGEGQGAVELASPSCPGASEVGVVNVGAGAGPQPYFVSGKAYLAGPYKGAPLSLEIITPAIAGPFDLGVVAVRTALHVDEATSQITAVSDPLPTILHGLPLDVRSISLNMNRPDFTLNPTSCDPKQITGSATSTLGNVAPLTQRFQVGACGALGFKPMLKLAYSGQTKRAGHPALRSVITYPKGSYANIARASVTLPKGVLIAEAHINNPCTRVQFNAGALPGEACPVKSVLGTAKVWTPLLEKPETGKVYFRSNGGERELPDLVIALRGQIPVQLVGFIDSVGRKNAEVRRVRTRFQSVPDAPVSRFELKLYGGKRGLLESSQNLCKGSPPATVQLTAQNGKAYDTEPSVTTACGKKSKQRKSGSKKK